MYLAAARSWRREEPRRLNLCATAGRSVAMLQWSRSGFWAFQEFPQNWPGLECNFLVAWEKSKMQSVMVYLGRKMGKLWDEKWDLLR